MRDPEALHAWYEQHLGLARTTGVLEFPAAQQRAQVVLALFGADEDHVPRRQPVMLNLQADVRDRLVVAGVPVDPERPAHDAIGRFGWSTDPEGNRVELWEPARDA